MTDQHNGLRQATGTAPGRVNLIGEHVDYQAGLCLPIALARATTAIVTARDDDRLVFTSGSQRWEGRVDDLAPGRISGWAAYVAGVAWALDVRRGLEVELTSDVPLGAGLSSSAALTCSVALALNDLADLGLDRPALVKAAIKAESEFVGAPTGGLDQTASLLATPGNALLIDFRSGESRPVPFAPAEHGLDLLVIDTRVSHAHADGGYGDRRAECEEAARLLGVPNLREATSTAGLPAPLDRRVHHVITEIQRVSDAVDSLHAGDWDGFGALMNASHDSLRDDFEVSCAELDAAVDAARATGALGARMTGGGFGGSAIALVPHDRAAALTDAVLAAFADHDWTEPVVFST